VFINKGYFEQHQGQSGGFHHYYLELTEESWVSEKQAKLFEKAANRYIPSILPNLISKLFPENGIDGLEKSFQVLNKVKEIIEKSTYGYHLLPSIEWMIRIYKFCKTKKIYDIKYRFQDRNQKWIFGSGILFWTDIHPDGDYGAVSPIIQQGYNNVLDLIISANNEKALQKMIENRMNPSHYMRPSTTKILSDKVITQSAQKLGDFSNTMMTIQEASELPFCISLKKISSSNEAYLKMMNPKKPTIHNFLEKSSITNIKTLTNLFEYIEKHPESDLKIYAPSMTPVYIAKTTLDEKFLSVPHFWAFLNQKKSSDFNIPDYVSVQLIIPMYKYIHSYKNIVFIIKYENDLKKFQHKIGNCCFPSFLNPTYQRELRNVFERLNTTMSININNMENAFGLGTSVKNLEKKLMKPITVYLNNVKYCIDEL
jgi:hypothetical protein